MLVGLSLPILLGAVVQAQDAAAPPERSEIDAKYKWNLADMYSSEKAWNAHYEQIDAMVKSFAALKGTASESPQSLLRVLARKCQT